MEAMLFLLLQTWCDSTSEQFKAHSTLCQKKVWAALNIKTHEVMVPERSWNPFDLVSEEGKGCGESEDIWSVYVILVTHAAHIPRRSMYVNSFDLVSAKVIACFHQYPASSPKTCTSLFSCIWTPNFRKACTLVHALAIHHLNPFDLVSDKVVSCNQCTDVCFVSAVVEM